MGESPRGFISPGWASSGKIVRVLNDLGYLYDTSLAPSWILLLAQVVLKMKSQGAKDLIPWIRADWKGNLFGRRKPYVPGLSNYLSSAKEGERASTLMLPLPTTAFIRLGIWHTLNFYFGEKFSQKILGNIIKTSESFYYLVHSIDLFDPEKDYINLPEDIMKVERMDLPYECKKERMINMFKFLSNKGSFVTMSEIAEDILRKK